MAITPTTPASKVGIIKIKSEDFDNPSTKTGSIFLSIKRKAMAIVVDNATEAIRRLSILAERELLEFSFFN